MLFSSHDTGAEARVTPAAVRATLAFVAWAAGQTLAWQLWERGLSLDSLVWFGAASLLLAVCAMGGRGPRGAALFVCVVLLGGGWFTMRVLELPSTSVAAVLGAEDNSGVGAHRGHLVTLEGLVVERPTRMRVSGALAGYLPIEPSVTFAMTAERAERPDSGKQVSGRVRVFVDTGEPGVEVGDRVRVTGLARVLTGPSNPGEPDARLWAAQRGGQVSLRTASEELVEVMQPREGIRAGAVRGWLRWREALRARAASVLPAEGGEPGRAMLAALLFGEREDGSDELRATFARQGLAHVLAISGFHLAVMAMAALFLVRLTGDRGRLEPLLVAVLVVLYVVVLPVRAPILRAAAMVLVWLLAESAGRRYDKRALLAWVAVAVLLVRPMDLFSLGYQLTFGITAVLIWFGSSVHARMFPKALSFERYEPPDPLERRWWTARATQLVSASVLCWLAATPLVARSVGIVSPGAVVATVLVVPAVTVLLWVSYAAMLIGVMVPAAAGLVSSVLGAVAGFIVAAVEVFDATPITTLYVPRFSISLTAALTALALLWLIRGRLRHPGLWSATLIVLGWAAGEWHTAGRLPHRDLLRIDTLDVGDGTCHLIRSGMTRCSGTAGRSGPRSAW